MKNFVTTILVALTLAFCGTPAHASGLLKILGLSFDGLSVDVPWKTVIEKTDGAVSPQADAVLLGETSVGRWEPCIGFEAADLVPRVPHTPQRNWKFGLGVTIPKLDYQLEAWTNARANLLETVGIDWSGRKIYSFDPTKLGRGRNTVNVRLTFQNGEEALKVFGITIKRTPRKVTLLAEFSVIVEECPRDLLTAEETVQWIGFRIFALAHGEAEARERQLHGEPFSPSGIMIYASREEPKKPFPFDTEISPLLKDVVTVTYLWPTENVDRREWRISLLFNQDVEIDVILGGKPQDIGRLKAGRRARLREDILTEITIYDRDGKELARGKIVPATADRVAFFKLEKVTVQ